MRATAGYGYAPMHPPAFSGDTPPLGAMFMARSGETPSMDLEGRMRAEKGVEREMHV